jgi:predicted ATP-dependent endonuclease of OLD family
LFTGLFLIAKNKMKICKLIVPEYQQFKNFELDLTYPEGHTKVGEPLDKVCFIGTNGTGKSTLLSLLQASLGSMSDEPSSTLLPIILKLRDNNKSFYFNNSGKFLPNKILQIFLSDDIDKKENWVQVLNENIKRFKKGAGYDADFQTYLILEESLKLKNNSDDLVIYSPAESHQNHLIGLPDIPETNLNEALNLFKNFSFIHFVSNSTIKEFWKLLVYLVKKRENERDIFENKEDSLNKTKKQLIEEFEKINPKILEKLSELWNRILAKAGLEFDFENAKIPIQLKDNLIAYIKLKSDNKKMIKYSELSTGIRNFIFRLGYIFALYFNRKISNGFLLVDEPENSLYPEFLYDLVNVYYGITQNTQLFMATHNPIIAAQFEPCERIILEFDENGFVTSRKGSAPVGDDPNDILTQDFELKNLMGKEGQKMWDKYIELKKKLIKSTSIKEKDELISQISSIGDKYNFEV